MDFNSAHLPMLISGAKSWVARLRQEHYSDADPIPPELLPTFVPFFPEVTLRRIRFRFVQEIPNPDFYPALEAQGLPIPLDFRNMAGLTLIDTVLISRSRADLSPGGLLSLLFHEAVHVLQYERLGLERFMAEYVHGWARSGFDYFAIPLEQQAYTLEARFREAPTTAFSVLEAVLTSQPPDPPAA